MNTTTRHLILMALWAALGFVAGRKITSFRVHERINELNVMIDDLKKDIQDMDEHVCQEDMDKYVLKEPTLSFNRKRGR